MLGISSVVISSLMDRRQANTVRTGVHVVPKKSDGSLNLRLNR